jgi:hypothetical protein
VVASITIVNIIIICFCKKVFMADRILIFEYSTFRCFLNYKLSECKKTDVKNKRPVLGG